MSEFIKKYQTFIKSQDARQVGKKGLEKETAHIMSEFFQDICKAVLGSKDEVYLIQWAISKLDPTDIEMLNKQIGEESCH